MPPTKKSNDTYEPDEVLVLIRRPASIKLAYPTGGTPEGKTMKGRPSVFKAFVTGPNIATAAEAKDLADMSACGPRNEVLIGEDAVGRCRSDFTEICETAQSIPGLRFMAKMIDDPELRALVEVRIRQLKKG